MSPPLHLDSTTSPLWKTEMDLLAGLADHYCMLEEEEGDAEGKTLGGYTNDRKQFLGSG